MNIPRFQRSSTAASQYQAHNGRIVGRKNPRDKTRLRETTYINQLRKLDGKRSHVYLSGRRDDLIHPDKQRQKKKERKTTTNEKKRCRIEQIDGRE